MLRIPPGDHVLVAGASGTGKTTALGQIVAGWSGVDPDGEVVRIDRRTPLTTDSLPPGDGVSMLVVADDAERIDDVGGVIAAIISSGRTDVTIMAAGRLDAIRAAYGHWTRDVAQSRCGMILTSAGEVDGELLGVTLPRRSLIAARPGLAWLIDTSGHRLVQVGRPEPDP